MKKIGLCPSRKIKLFNGKLETRFLQYEMYEGTNKIHKLEGNSSIYNNKLMSWNFFDIFDVVFDLFGLLGSGSKSSRSKSEKNALNHNVISQKKDSKDPDSSQRK